MKARLKKIGYLALLLGAMAMALSSTGCSSFWGSGPYGSGPVLQRPGWIIPK